MKTCSVDGCDKNVVARDYCMTHYRRLLRTGDVNTKKPVPSICTVDGCNKVNASQGLCAKHRYHVRKANKQCYICGKPNEDRYPKVRCEPCEKKVYQYRKRRKGKLNEIL